MHAIVCKRYKFSAAHHLPDHPSKCQRNHGHTFWADVYARGPIKSDGRCKGMVVDYSTLTDAWRELEALVDHSDLNEHFDYPTTEHVACAILSHMRSVVPEVFKVKLWEGPGQFAEVSVDY